MRWLLLVLIIGFAGCGSSIVPESADAKAIRAFVRQSEGDSADVGPIRIVETGTARQYEVKFPGAPDFALNWTDKPSNRCVIATIGKGPRGLYEIDSKGKVYQHFATYKRK